MQDFGNQYAYISRLGEGSYGSVLLCREQAPGQRGGAHLEADESSAPTLVAVKKFKWAHNYNMGLRLALREIRILKSLDHPLIIPLRRAFFSRNCRLYAVFPYVDGGCSQTVLKSRYPRGMAPVLLKSFAWQLCVAVRYLHQQRVLHRDIKPANVLLSSDGTIRLCDFGFACRVSELGAASVLVADGGKEPGALTPYIQTRPYRAPEVLLGQSYGSSADIWAIGATVAEMAIGEVLLPGSSSLDQLWRILGAVPEPRPPALARAVETLKNLDPAALGTDVPPELLNPKELPGRPLSERLAAASLEPALMEFILACLRLDPYARPSADELLAMPYLAGAGDVLAGNVLLEELHASLATEAVTPGGSSARVAVASCVYENSRDVAAARRNKVPLTRAGRSGALPQAAAVAAAQSVPAPAATAAAGTLTLAGPRRRLVGNSGMAGAVQHRRSLSAGNRADALMAEVAAEAPYSRRPPPVGGLPDGLPPELWRFPVAAPSEAAVAAVSTTGIEMMPPQPPTPAPSNHPRAWTQAANLQPQLQPPSLMMHDTRVEASAATLPMPIPQRQWQQQPQRRACQQGEAWLAASVDSAGGAGPESLRGSPVAPSAVEVGGRLPAGRQQRATTGKGLFVFRSKPSQRRPGSRQVQFGAADAQGSIPFPLGLRNMHRNSSAPELLGFAEGEEDDKQDQDDEKSLASEAVFPGVAAAVAPAQVLGATAPGSSSTAAAAAAALRRGPSSTLMRGRAETACGMLSQRETRRQTKTGMGPAKGGSDLLPDCTALKNDWATVGVLDDDESADVAIFAGTAADGTSLSFGMAAATYGDSKFRLLAATGEPPAAAAAALCPDADAAAVAWSAIFNGAADAVAVNADDGGDDGAGSDDDEYDDDDDDLLPRRPRPLEAGNSSSVPTATSDGYSRGKMAGGMRTSGFNRWRATCLGYANSGRHGDVISTARGDVIGKGPPPRVRQPAAPPARSVQPAADIREGSIRGEGCYGPADGHQMLAAGFSDGSAYTHAASASGTAIMVAEDGCGTWAPQVLANSAGSVDAANVYGRRSCGAYGMRKTLYDTDEGWLAEMAWRGSIGSKAGRECGGAAAAAAAAAAQLSSPQRNKVNCSGMRGGEARRSAGGGGGRRLGLSCGFKATALRLLCLGGGAAAAAGTAEEL